MIKSNEKWCSEIKKLTSLERRNKIESILNEARRSKIPLLKIIQLEDWLNLTPLL